MYYKVIDPSVSYKVIDPPAGINEWQTVNFYSETEPDELLGKMTVGDIVKTPEGEIGRVTRIYDDRIIFTKEDRLFDVPLTAFGNPMPGDAVDEISEENPNRKFVRKVGKI